MPEELITTQTDVSVAAPATELETAAQSSSAGGDVLAPLSTQEGAEVLSFEVPEADILNQDGTQYAKLETIQPLLERSKSATTELATLKPYQELGPLEAVKTKLTIADKLLSSIVVDQGKVVGYDFKPFIEYVAEENGPTTIEDLFKDLLTYKVDNEELSDKWDKARGLDPKRLSEYKQIDSLIATSGAITPDELADIDPNYHDAYRALPDEIRRDFSTLSDSMKLYHLNREKDMIDTRKNKEIEAKQKERDEAQIEAERQKRIEAVGWNKVAQIRQEKASEVINELRKYKFSNDPKTDAVNRSAVVALCLFGLEPLWRFAVEDGMKALGVTFDSSFDQLLNVMVGQTIQAEAHREYGENLFVNQCETNVSNAVAMVMAKMAPIVVQVRKLMGAELAEKAKEQSDLLGGAKETIPFTTSGDSATSRPAYSIADAAARAFERSQPA